MKISWYGQGLFSISDRIGKKKVRVIINPFEKDTGLKPPTLKADILLSSNKENHNLKVAKGKPFTIDNPGEYEIKKVFIQGIPTFEFKEKKVKNKDGEIKKKVKRIFDKNIIYTVEINNTKVCHLGDLKQKELKEDQLDEIGIVDVLLVPVGGNNTITADEATDIIGQIEPGMIIPMHYSVPKLKTKLDPVEKFLKLIKAEKVKAKEKITISQKDIDFEKPTIITLQKR